MKSVLENALSCAGVVQMWLAKESVLWKRGFYTFPPVSTLASAAPCLNCPQQTSSLLACSPIKRKACTVLKDAKRLSPDRVVIASLA